MPQYLYPGVYIEESDAGATPIEGVPTAIGLPFRQALVGDLARVVRAHAPAWTGGADADPGVALADLIAFLADQLHDGDRAPGPRVRAAAIRAASVLAGVAGAAARDCAPLARPRYFAGRLLDAAALTAEQDYHREKLRRHQRALHGAGVVWGLDVRVEAGGAGAAARVAVAPGAALDPAGELLCLPCGARLAPPAGGGRALVTLRYGERTRTPVPVAGSDAPEDAETEEICIVGVGAVAPDAAIVLARLLSGDGGWQVDAAFVPPRCRV